MRKTSVVFAALSVLVAPGLAHAQLPASSGVVELGGPGRTLHADARIGFVDLGRVASLSKEGRALVAKIEDLRVKKEFEVEARGKDVAALQDKLAQASAVLNETARDQLRKQFERAQVDFQRFTQDARTEVAQVQRELEQAFMQKAFPAIADVAKERALWAVFSVGESGLVWREPTLDISEEIANRMDTAP